MRATVLILAVVFSIQLSGQNLGISLSVEPVHCKKIPDGKANAIVSGGTAPYQFLWNTGYTASSIKNLETGTYSVTVTDADSNVITSSVEFHTAYYEDLNIITPDTIFTCLGDPKNLCALGSGGKSSKDYVFTWSNGFSEDSVETSCQNVMETATTEYRVILSDGCMYNDTSFVQYIVYPIPINCYPPLMNEGCAPFQVSFAASASIANTIFEWDIDGDNIIDTVARTFDWTYSIPGIYDIIMTATSPQGCVTVIPVYQYITVLDPVYNDCATSINEQTDNISVYSGNKQVIIEQNITDVVYIQIFNIEGKSILIEEVKNQTHKIDINQPTGIYFYSLHQKSEIIQSGKLLIR